MTYKPPLWLTFHDGVPDNPETISKYSWPRLPVPRSAPYSERGVPVPPLSLTPSWDQVYISHYSLWDSYQGGEMLVMGKLEVPVVLRRGQSFLMYLPMKLCMYLIHIEGVDDEVLPSPPHPRDNELKELMTEPPVLQPHIKDVNPPPLLAPQDITWTEDDQHWLDRFIHRVDIHRANGNTNVMLRTKHIWRFLHLFHDHLPLLLGNPHPEIGPKPEQNLYDALVAAKLSGHRDDDGYFTRSNERAAETAMDVVAVWLKDQPWFRTDVQIDLVRVVDLRIRELATAMRAPEPDQRMTQEARLHSLVREARDMADTLVADNIEITRLRRLLGIDDD